MGSVRCVMKVDVLILLLSSVQTGIILITKGLGGVDEGRGWCGQCQICDEGRCADSVPLLSKDRNYPHHKV